MKKFSLPTHIILFTSIKCNFIEVFIGKVKPKGFKNSGKLLVLKKNPSRNNRSSFSSSDSE